MTYRFADFQLDEERRELRLGDREIGVQPRVFDLLSYLIRHRHRVVGKDELLEALWPGSVVVDGALQRVVSLARSALEEGDARNAIRTYARHGYRFCADMSVADEPPVRDSTHACLAHAREAFERNDWATALAAFAKADAQEALEGADLERWAQAAQWVGNAGEALGPLERAVVAYLTRNDRRAAARAALLLAQIQLERLEIPVAKGWLRRAQSLLPEAEPCRELGLAHYAAARLALLDGASDQCLEHAESLLKLGSALGDADLEGLGLAYRGHALLTVGDISRGVECLDEAAAAALAGTMTPWVASTIYCSVIWACRNRGDWDRAARWTDQFTRWCERSGLAAFPGTCRLHRAEVLSIRGELAEAEKEINESTELLAIWAPWAEGDAYRVLGDLRLAQGDLDAAEAAYRQAHTRGWNPQPGYAMLQMARGQAEIALRSLENALTDRSWTNSERRGLLLADLAIAAAAAGSIERGRSALDELEHHPDLWSATAVEAVVLRARGELALAEEKYAEAVNELREAVKIWRRVGSPLNAAIAQLRLSQAMIATGDRSGAELEISAAEASFERLRAAHLLEHCAKVRHTL